VGFESAGPVLVLVMGAAAVAAYALRLRRALATEAEVRELALTDRLTALPNRRAFDADVQQVLAHSSRCGERFAILMVDIDFFKFFGVALWELGEDVELLFSRAHEALYRAKAVGRNRVELAG